MRAVLKATARISGAALYKSQFLSGTRSLLRRVCRFRVTGLLSGEGNVFDHCVTHHTL